ncbi:hypothetical protein IFM89_004020 [Coptis chinensis]|uniref:Uncharacterized protein n=1 Tax=Coptis chinensis TaxID=261450 RepID=A0A835GX82_9MAGN|nr:hypothetical protein IFM89_004020 [Coptis chinensis]
MESSVLQLSSHFTFFTPKTNSLPAASPFWPCKRRTSSCQPTPLRCHKMFVPGFGEASPEAKAAKNLHGFFTYVAVKIVVAQLEEPETNVCYLAEQSYNPEAYEELMEFLSKNSLNDGDQFCANLMRESSRHQGLGRLNLHTVINIFIVSFLLHNTISY